MRLSNPGMAVGIMDVHMIDLSARALQNINHRVRVEQAHRQHVDRINQPALAIIAVERPSGSVSFTVAPGNLPKQESNDPCPLH
jgi:hypothetical protein